MKRKTKGPGDGGIGLSFLDVLSNGLGVSILLFIILSSMRSASDATQSGGEHFIRLKWTVFDRQAIVQAWIMAPGGSGKRDFFDLETHSSGSVIYDRPSYAKGKVVLFGFTERGPDAALQENKDGVRVYVMRIQSPTPGRWRIGALYVNRADALEARAGDNVKVTVEVQHSSTNLGTQEKLVPFANEITFRDIEVTE